MIGRSFTLTVIAVLVRSADGNIQGTEIYRSAKLDSYSDAEHISIDISGIQKNLVLFMDKVENNAHDNGDWQMQN